MSGFKVNFSVNNQLATPSIHAAALANRPAAGQPGRVFIDTDNPSTGIYRDTGTAWVQIAQNGGGGGGDLQTVTAVGNTTNLNLVLTYEDATTSNALVFYNVDQSQEEYVVLKRQSGMTTNDCLVIQSRGNISPSTNPAGIMIDGANDVIKTFYTTAYTELGLKLDFVNNSFLFGDYNGISGNYTYLNVDSNNGIFSIYSNSNYKNFQADGPFVDIGDVDNVVNFTILQVDDSNQLIKTKNQGNDIGLKLDFANNIFILGNPNVIAGIAGGIKVDTNNNATTIGDFNLSNNATTLFIDDNNGIIKSTYFYSDKGLKLDFANNQYSLGDLNANYNFVADGINGRCVMGDFNGNVNGTQLEIDDVNQRLEVSGNLASGTAGGNSGQHLKIRVGGVDYKIALLNP